MIDTSVALAANHTLPTAMHSDTAPRRELLIHGLDNSPQVPASLKLLSQPTHDYALVLREQLETAKVLRSRKLPTQSIGERLLSLIEGSWAPAPNDLPQRPSSRDVGRSELPFRQDPTTATRAFERKETKRFICDRERRWKLSAWSSVYEYDVPLRNLPTALHGLSIVHLSDVHLLASHKRPVTELITFANFIEQTDRKLDLVLLSGDLITKGPEDLCTAALEALHRISSVCPLSYMVHGNHDYHGHVPALISHQLESVGFTNINNHHVKLSIDGVRLNIYGVDDEYFGRPVAPRVAPQDELNILVTHNLDAIRNDCAAGIDLMLSGHTHWGEMRGFDGAALMRAWGYCDNVNRHTKHWEMLNDRTLSFVHPGLARYYVPWKGLRHPPGFVIHQLVPHPLD